MRALATALLGLNLSLHQLLLFAEGHGRVNRQPQLLDQLGVVDTTVERMAQQGDSHAQHAAE